MSYRALLLVGLLSGCLDEVPVVEAHGPAGTDIIPPITREATEGLATYRWEVIESVEDSFVTGTSATTPRAAFQFDRRGQYLLARWIESGLSERLTHHVVVTVSGVRPQARLLGSRYIGVGETGRFDGGTSSSFEDRELTYRWQLVRRPGMSQASLPATEIETSKVSIVPDVAGMYGIQLRVFDGELWSDPVESTLEAHD